MSQHLKPAVFLDRDGTIIEDRGHLRSASDVVFYPDTFQALQQLQEHFRLFIITHQSGIAKGLLTPEEVARVNHHVVEELSRHNITISDVYSCPHNREDQCPCIKPKPFFLQKAAREHAIDLHDSFTVGDHPADVELADSSGACGIYVMTGHGPKHRAELSSARLVVPGIREAAEWILACLAMRRQEKTAPGQLDSAAAILQKGGVVAFPTETVYGLGADTFNEIAVARIFEIKQRPRFDPLIVHVHAPGQLELLAASISETAKAVMDHFWPGPLTLIFPKTPEVPDLVTAGLPTVAVRMPRHPMALELIRRAGTPIAAPSANPFGQTSPTTAQHVLGQLADQVDLVLDGGPCPIGVESTILSLSGEQPTFLRPGGTPVEEIEALIGPVARDTTGSNGPIQAPGMLVRHYATRTPLRIAQAGELKTSMEKGRIGLLVCRKVEQAEGYAAVEILSEDGNLRTAAANLFGAMHRLDEQGLDLILAEPVPDTGLGRAINDRLRRAAVRD